MQFTHLGRSGLQVSRLCHGTMNFGWHTDEVESTIHGPCARRRREIFDTADAYGKSASEELIGRWFANDRGRREKVVLATKLYIDTNFAGWHLAQANETARRRDHLGLISEQEPLQVDRAHRRTRGCCPPRRRTASA